MKSFNAFISTSEERTNKCPSNIPNTQGSFSILLNLTAHSPQPPLESLFFLGILLCKSSFISIIWAVLSSASYNLCFLCLASKCWVSHWPSLLDIPGSFHPFKPSFMPQWFSNFYLHGNCTSDLQTPIIHSSPFPEYFTGTPKQKFSKMTSPSPNMSLCQLSPSWYMTLLLLLSRFSRVRLCNPIDGSPPGSPVPGILQARTLEWVAISFSNVWKWKVKVKSLSCVRLLVTPWTVAHQDPPSMGFSRQEYWSGVPLPSPVHDTISRQKPVSILSFCYSSSTTTYHWRMDIPQSIRNLISTAITISQLDCLQQLLKWPSYVCSCTSQSILYTAARVIFLKQRSNVSLLHLQPSFLQCPTVH